MAEAVASENPTREKVEERERGESFCAQRIQPHTRRTGIKSVVATAMNHKVDESILSSK